MFKKRRLGALGILAGTTILMVGALAGPATAVVIQPPCTGSATFSDGTQVTESTPLSPPITVPPTDTVTYEGSTQLPPPGEPETFSGSVKLDTPMGVGFTIVSWPTDPGSTTEKTSVEPSTYTYTVPEWVPRDTGPIEVTASHTQRGQTCIVALNFVIEGDRGPLAYVAAAGTAIFGAGVIGAGIKRKVV